MTISAGAKVASFILCLAGGFGVNEANEPPLRKTPLRGQNRVLALGGTNGGGDGQARFKKLDAEGCTLLEKANLCYPREDNLNPVPCEEDEKREFACEEVSTGAIYRVDNDMIDLASSNHIDNDLIELARRKIDIEPDADIFQSGRTMFVGDADVDLDTGRLSFTTGRFKKCNGGGNVNGRDGRRLVSGSRTVVALNVVSSEGTTTGYSNAHLADSLFGSLVRGSDMVNLASQYTACSHGQLNFGPVPDGTSGAPSVVSNIKDGVATIFSTESTARGDTAMRNDAVAKLATGHGFLAGADFVMICLPDAAMSGIAYAYINHYLSVYSHTWCTFPSTQLHEVGHNLGLAHSAEGGNEYADQSGFMGYSYSEDEQRICPNGPKIWQLGWFADRHVTLSPFDSFHGDLWGTTVYDTTNSNDKMILRIHDPTCADCDVYVSFNHHSLMNSDTREGQNRVQVHTRTGNPDSYGLSEVVAKLAAGGERKINVNGKSVPIKVGIVDATAGYARVTVGNMRLRPLPTPSPTKTPATGSYYLACGSSAKACAGQTQAADVAEKHELRCCADSDLGDDWIKYSGCPRSVWGASVFGSVCHHEVDFNAGRGICESNGGRLCTKEEVLDQCTRKSGCGHDSDMVWTSSQAVATPSPAAIPPLPSLYKVVCGSSKGLCRNDPILNAEASELHEVRCCSETSIAGWVKKSNCNVWGESNLGSPAKCHAEKTHAEAEAICKNAGARLCTEEEIHSDCTARSGCGYDGQYNWSSTPAQVCTDHASSGCSKLVACGSTANKCKPAPMVKPAGLQEAHEVRCCSDNYIAGWVIKEACKTTGTLRRNVWGQSKIDGQCHFAKTHAEAKTICLGASARLCTKEEVRADCARGSGCNFDHVHVWTSTDPQI